MCACYFNYDSISQGAICEPQLWKGQCHSVDERFKMMEGNY
jgi:hypothetical protein